jgi:hypothetical protein
LRPERGDIGGVGWALGHEEVVGVGTFDEAAAESIRQVPGDRHEASVPTPADDDCRDASGRGRVEVEADVPRHLLVMAGLLPAAGDGIGRDRGIHEGTHHEGPPVRGSIVERAGDGGLDPVPGPAGVRVVRQEPEGRRLEQGEGVDPAGVAGRDREGAVAAVRVAAEMGAVSEQRRDGLGIVRG